ncbi:unnamed protein product [Porites evermanni]|uniref:Purple acid phosphatase n=1 Tax=Porites evermanni TaxID=104178 RepID=A0ABN8RKH5_9CNID|nr:unnamed protein product [Porites evermanni]
MASIVRQCMCSVLLLFLNNCYGDDPQPQQIHLASTGDPTEMMVTWVTLTLTNYSIVEYNKGGFPLTLRATGAVTKFTDGGSQHRVLYMHRVKLTGLAYDQVYDYHCGGWDGWSALFSFKTFKSGVDWSPRLAVFGDLGSVNAKSLSYLQEETQMGHFDGILHVGDFAYNMDTTKGRLNDYIYFSLNSFQECTPSTFSSNLTVNFSNYRSRFSMPGNSEGIFYSWNIGPAHIISISTEVYFFLNYGLEQVVQQYNWLEKDLQEAASPKNRKLHPWIITMGHRPMYCSNSDGDDCTKHESVVRGGLTSKHLFPLEDLFYKYGVDLSIWAHEHSYERLFPIYKRQVSHNFFVLNIIINIKDDNAFLPHLLLVQSTGCQEDHDPFEKDYPPWTAYRSEDYGYTRMTIFNETHLFMDQVSVDKEGEVIDKVWIIKDSHGPEAWTAKQ